LMLVLASIANLFPQPSLVALEKRGSSGKDPIFLRLRGRRSHQPTKQ
jgi:hypothetical protein